MTLSNHRRLYSLGVIPVQACLSMIQVLLGLKEDYGAGAPIRFHNRKVAFQMPAGLTLLSIAGEVTQALPSWMGNAKYDILRNAAPTAQPDLPKDSVWPSQPPRSDLYCHTATIQRFVIHSWFLQQQQAGLAHRPCGF